MATPITRSRWAALVATLTVALMLAAGSAAAGTASEARGTPAASADVAQADRAPDIPLEDVSVRTIQGVPRDGGCQFSGQDVGGHDPRPVLERSISIDGATCEMRLERGYVPERHVDALMDSSTDTGPSGPGVATATEHAAAERSGASTADETGSGEPDSDVGAAVTRRREAWHRTWWRDPPGLVVNSVQPNVRWSYDWSCASNGVYWTDHTWLSGSGWSKVASNTQAFYGCGAQTTSSYAHFRNGAFCFGVDTHAYYDRTVITGRSDGSYHMSWNSWVSGGCTSLLTFQRSHGYTQIF